MQFVQEILSLSYRGLDHPFSLNEFKDYLFKMRENYLIQKYPGVQYLRFLSFSLSVFVASFFDAFG